MAAWPLYPQQLIPARNWPELLMVIDPQLPDGAEDTVHTEP